MNLTSHPMNKAANARTFCPMHAVMVTKYFSSGFPALISRTDILVAVRLAKLPFCYT